MKRLALLATLVACGRPSQQAASPAPAACAPCTKPDGSFAMKPYFLVLLRRGPAWTPEKTPETTRLFEGHMANMEVMAKAGKLVLAGPTDVPETERAAIAGIFLFHDTDRAGVEALLQGDPAIAAGRLTAEILSWYGPAGLTYPGKVDKPN